MLNPSLSGTGMLSLKETTGLTHKDLNNFSSLHFLNVTTNNIFNLKKITELKLLKTSLAANKLHMSNKLFLDQNSKMNNCLILSSRILNNYLYIPTSTFYENEQTFINTEGFIKRTTKLILKQKTIGKF